MMLARNDMWDPDNWGIDDHEHRIYYSDNVEEDYVVVDGAFYPYLSKFRWSLHSLRKATKGLIYLRRGISEFYGESTRGSWYTSEFTGKPVRARNRVQKTMFLHVEVLKLAGVTPQSPEHREGDHINRKTRDCRLNNLRWATRLEQLQNSRARGFLK